MGDCFDNIGEFVPIDNIRPQFSKLFYFWWFFDHPCARIVPLSGIIALLVMKC